MPTYEYGRIAKLAESLQQASIPQHVMDEILAGGEAIRKKDGSERKADWMRAAMLRMDQLLDEPTRYAVREACACCLGGKRLQMSRGIARRNRTLEDRVQAANEAKFVFGHSVALQEDGRILVRFSPEGLPEYGCVCLRRTKEPLSITYCYCCGGHVKHHLQTALGRSLACTVVCSALSSGGKRPCTFLFALED